MQPPVSGVQGDQIMFSSLLYPKPSSRIPLPLGAGHQGEAGDTVLAPALAGVCSAEKEWGDVGALPSSMCYKAGSQSWGWGQEEEGMVSEA